MSIPDTTRLFTKCAGGDACRARGSPTARFEATGGIDGFCVSLPEVEARRGVASKLATARGAAKLVVSSTVALVANIFIGWSNTYRCRGRSLSLLSTLPPGRRRRSSSVETTRSCVVHHASRVADLHELSLAVHRHELAS
jgi:hypothetical protein